MGLVKTPDVDQTADSIVVTAQIPVERAGVLEGPSQTTLHVTGLFFGQIGYLCTCSGVSNGV